MKNPFKGTDSDVNDNIDKDEVKADEENIAAENTEIEAEEKIEETPLTEEANPLQEKYDTLNNQYIRLAADFDNYRKRTDKEKSAMFEMGASDVIKKLLPIVDNFERGFKSVTEEELQTPFAKGMDMVYKQTMKMLEDLQVKPIEALGSEFNPDFHNAVMHVEDDSQGENIIVEEFEKGYTYRDVVIRHSMVKVAN